MALETVCIMPFAYMLVFVFCMGALPSFHPIGFFLTLAGVLSVVTMGRLLCWSQCQFFECARLGCLLGY